jgi:hypothetical protein
LAEVLGLDFDGGAGGAEGHARGRAIGIVRQMAGAMVLSRAASHVAHDHADELTELHVLSQAPERRRKGRPSSVSPVN